MLKSRFNAELVKTTLMILAVRSNFAGQKSDVPKHYLWPLLYLAYRSAVPRCLFALARYGVTDDAPLWAKSTVELARELRCMLRLGGDPPGTGLVRVYTENLDGFLYVQPRSKCELPQIKVSPASFPLWLLEGFLVELSIAPELIDDEDTKWWYEGEV